MKNLILSIPFIRSTSFRTHTISHFILNAFKDSSFTVFLEHCIIDQNGPNQQYYFIDALNSETNWHTLHQVLMECLKKIKKYL